MSKRTCIKCGVVVDLPPTDEPGYICIDCALEAMGRFREDFMGFEAVIEIQKEALKTTEKGDK